MIELGVKGRSPFDSTRERSSPTPSKFRRLTRHLRRWLVTEAFILVVGVAIMSLPFSGAIRGFLLQLAVLLINVTFLIRTGVVIYRQRQANVNPRQNDDEQETTADAA